MPLQLYSPQCSRPAVCVGRSFHDGSLQRARCCEVGACASNLPKGAVIAVLTGDPFKDGPYVLRLKMPANYRIPAHHHPTTENVTVVSGSFHAGMGDKLYADKGQVFEPGGFVSMPAGMNHFAWATTETIVQVHGNGPFAIVYVNPADDPSKAP